MDESLRNALWSLLKVFVWDTADISRGGTYLPNTPQLKNLCEQIWFHFFKIPLDTLDDNWPNVLVEIRQYYFKAEWYEVYDFIEFVAQHFEDRGFESKFTETCNRAFEREMSAYRFIDQTISRITDQQELATIDEALSSTQSPVSTHLLRSLELLSDRGSPDYRNSIKESISALESLVSKLLGEKGTLGQLLKNLEDEIGLHPALRNAFSNLYGYTSDESGIRHSIWETERVDFADAKFFLVTCSAFINFVQQKVSKPG